MVVFATKQVFDTAALQLPAELERFQAELAALQQLQAHPHILHFTAWGQQQAITYVLFEPTSKCSEVFACLLDWRCCCAELGLHFPLHICSVPGLPVWPASIGCEPHRAVLHNH